LIYILKSGNLFLIEVKGILSLIENDKKKSGKENEARLLLFLQQRGVTFLWNYQRELSELYNCKVHLIPVGFCVLVKQINDGKLMKARDSVLFDYIFSFQYVGRVKISKKNRFY
jgi:hypothetical protein